MVDDWSQRACLETLKVTIEIDQQAQSDGLSKIKAVNNDPVKVFLGWIQQFKLYYELP